MLYYWCNLVVLLCQLIPLFALILLFEQVLERTAKGMYRMDGPDWECISEEAKDLVRKMLTVDPQQRITTPEILSHPFLRLEEEEVEEEVVIAVDAGGLTSPSGDLGTATSPALRKTASTARGMTGGSKRSVNLNNALRLLSGHVSDLRTEKFAMTFTRLVSSLDSGPSKQGRTSMLSQLVVPLGKATGVMSVSGKPPGAAAEEEMMMFQNPEIKEALASAINSVGDEQGRLSLEQFMYILKHFAFARTIKVDDGAGGAEESDGVSAGKSANPGTGLAMMLLCRYFDVITTPIMRIISFLSHWMTLFFWFRFVDRDGDGMISADDVFTTQALILQRSESFVKVCRYFFIAPSYIVIVIVYGCCC